MSIINSLIFYVRFSRRFTCLSTEFLRKPITKSPSVKGVLSSNFGMLPARKNFAQGVDFFSCYPVIESGTTVHDRFNHIAMLLAIIGGTTSIGTYALCESSNSMQIDKKTFEQYFQLPVHKQVMEEFELSYKAYNVNQNPDRSIELFEELVHSALPFNDFLNMEQASWFRELYTQLLDEKRRLKTINDRNQNANTRANNQIKLHRLEISLQNARALTLTFEHNQDISEPKIVEVVVKSGFIKFISELNPLLVGVGTGVTGAMIGGFIKGPWGLVYGFIIGFPAGVGTQYGLDYFFNEGKGWQNFRDFHPWEAKAVFYINQALIAIFFEAAVNHIEVHYKVVNAYSKELQALCDVLLKNFSKSNNPELIKFIQALKQSLTPEKVKRLMEMGIKNSARISGMLIGLTEKERALLTESPKRIINFVKQMLTLHEDIDSEVKKDGGPTP